MFGWWFSGLLLRCNFGTTENALLLRVSRKGETLFAVVTLVKAASETYLR